MREPNNPEAVCPGQKEGVLAVDSAKPVRATFRHLRPDLVTKVSQEICKHVTAGGGIAVVRVPEPQRVGT